MIELSEIHALVLRKFQAYLNYNGHAPTTEELMELTGISFPFGVVRIVKDLENLGVLKRDKFQRIKLGSTLPYGGTIS